MKLTIVRTATGVWVGWPGRAKFFAPERTNSTGASRHHEEVRAPMTGKVVKVRVKPGDKVKTNDVVAVLEAMKMEFRLAAPYDGTVDGVHCKEGELVDLGKTLVTLTRNDSNR